MSAGEETSITEAIRKVIVFAYFQNEEGAQIWGGVRSEDNLDALCFLFGISREQVEAISLAGQPS